MNPYASIGGAGMELKERDVNLRTVDLANQEP